MTNNHASFRWWRKKNLEKYQKAFKYYDHGCRFRRWPSWVKVFFFLTKSILLRLGNNGNNDIRKNKTEINNRI